MMRKKLFLFLVLFAFHYLQAQIPENIERLYDLQSLNQQVLIKNAQGQVLDISTVKTVTLSQAPENVLLGKISPDGQYIITNAQGEKSATLWIIDGILQKVLAGGHNYEVYSLAFSPDSKIIATGGQGQQVDRQGEGKELSLPSATTITTNNTTGKNYTETLTANGKSYSFEMIWVEAGSFEMGSNDPEAWDWEKPVHTVSLDGFYIAGFEVTQELWRAVIGSDSDWLHNKGCNKCPVEGVSWEEAVAFTTKLQELTGRRYSLPTEAQWEYAARGGQEGKDYKYAGSNNIDEVTWYDEDYGESNHGERGTTYPVGTKAPNELGIYDMTGNVWEWCLDWYSEDYYTSSPTANPTGPATGDKRVLRGGSWFDYARHCRVANRSHNSPTSRLSNGFRVVRLP